MNGRGLNEMYQNIEALMIIYNMLEEFGDDPTTIWGFNGLEDEGVEVVRGEVPDWIDIDLDSDDLYRSGLLRCKHLLDLAVPRH